MSCSTNPSRSHDDQVDNPRRIAFVLEPGDALPHQVHLHAVRTPRLRRHDAEIEELLATRPEGWVEFPARVVPLEELSVRRVDVIREPDTAPEIEGRQVFDAHRNRQSLAAFRSHRCRPRLDSRAHQRPRLLLWREQMWRRALEIDTRQD